MTQYIGYIEAAKNNGAKIEYLSSGFWRLDSREYMSEFDAYKAYCDTRGIKPIIKQSA